MPAGSLVLLHAVVERAAWHAEHGSDLIDGATDAGGAADDIEVNWRRRPTAFTWPWPSLAHGAASQCGGGITMMAVDGMGQARATSFFIVREVSGTNAIGFSGTAPNTLF
jgi:hypothetical protein